MPNAPTLLNLKTKKIIAREFLILLLAICLTMGFRGGIAIWNNRYVKALQEASQEYDAMEAERIRLVQTYDYKLKNQEKFFDWYDHIFYFNDYRTPDSLWVHFYEMAETDSLRLRFEKKWNEYDRSLFDRFGFSNGWELQAYILRNQLTQSERLAQARVEDLATKQRMLQQRYDEFDNLYLTEEEIWDRLTLFVLCLLGLLYPVRFLVIAIRWSIRVLRTK